MKQVKYSLEWYGKLSAYVLQNIDPVSMDNVEECYMSVNRNERFSIEYSYGCIPLTDKIEDLINKWIEENDIDRASFLTHIEGNCWWMIRDVEGSFFNLVYRLFMDVCHSKNICNDIHVIKKT